MRSDLSCVAPFGQGRCLQGGLWSEEGACVHESCDAAGMEEYCGEGLRCVAPELLPRWAYRRHRVEADFGSFPSLPMVEFATTTLCVDSCTVPAADCVGEGECQGEAVGCRAGFACVDLGDGADEGVCLASCSASNMFDPDSFCDDLLGLDHCNLDRGVCE